jgi:hypothetical protein
VKVRAYPYTTTHSTASTTRSTAMQPSASCAPWPRGRCEPLLDPAAAGPGGPGGAAGARYSTGRRQLGATCWRAPPAQESRGPPHDEGELQACAALQCWWGAALRHAAAAAVSLVRAAASRVLGMEPRFELMERAYRMRVVLSPPDHGTSTARARVVATHHDAPWQGHAMSPCNIHTLEEPRVRRPPR